jgi:tripartite-type tricarboxylate transporter receptor subunit TctC
MKTIFSKPWTACLMALLLPWSMPPAWGDSVYPDRPINYVVPNAAGGSGDVIARILAEKLHADLQVPIVIENRAGATGVIGAGFVARSSPDGYTLLVSSTGPMAIVPSLQPSLPYDPATAFAPVIKIAESHTVLVVSARKPWHTVQDIVAAAKAAPGALSFASGGIGTVLHLQGELFKIKTGVEMIHVPYKGDAPAVADLISGRVSMMFVPTQAVMGQVQAGQLRLIATTSLHRLQQFRDTPTMAEAGVPDFVSDAWFGAFVPAKTPATVIARLNRSFNLALHDPGVADRLEKLGLSVVGGEPGALAEAQRTDTARWAQVVKTAHVRLAD